MAKELKQRIFDTVHSGLNSTVQSLQAAVQSQALGSSSFYPTTLDQLENVQSGWLWKQGGIVRSWHRRYFIMKGDYIYYYGSDDDCSNGKPPLGSIFLPGNCVVEVPFSSNDAEKFQFEIQTGDATRMSSMHETYLLAAETDDERKDWIRAIKQFLYSLSGGAIFGQSLERTLQYEQKLCSKSRKVPHIVESCVTYLRQNGLHEEGLFRLPGRSVVICQLQEMFDRGERPLLTIDDPPGVTLDVHTVASLLKSYLRELPAPLVPYELYEDVMLIVTREVPVIGEDRAVVKLADLLASRLSPANYNTLQYVCQFLADVAQCAEDNKMNTVNLATVFAQCFLCPDADGDPGLMLATSANRTIAAQLMISQCNKMFSVEYTAAGTAIMTADLLGLDARNSIVDSGRQSRVSVVNFDVQDLIGLDFGGSVGTQSLTRPSAMCRPKPVERQHANRAGIVDDVHWQRDAVLVQDTAEYDSTSVNGPAPSAAGETPPRTQPGTKDHNPATVEERPVPARRAAIRSSSFDSHISTSSTAKPALPVPPPKRNRQQMASNIAALQSQLDQLNTQLKSVTDERDVALAKVSELEAELTRYREKFGRID